MSEKRRSELAARLGESRAARAYTPRMAATRYFDLVREMRDAYNHRLRLVQSARDRGIKPTARLFATTVPTVRKWLRRFQQQGPSGLLDLSRAPHHQPRRTPAYIERQVVALRQTLPTFGSRRLIREFDLPLSHRALERIWRLHGLMKKRRRKYQRKQDLAAIKARWSLFQQISADTKDLDDIPHYWPQAQRLGLPLIQYTAREVRSGLLFWSFAQRRSAAASAVFASRIQQHLARYGVSLRDLVWQTDNGGEFKGDFPSALLDSQHVLIPPAAHTYQSDVETVHRLEEDEFFDLESFTSRGDFLNKTQTYQLYFNLARTNSHKENLSPLQIIERLAPRSPSNSACFHRSSWTTTSTQPGDTMWRSRFPYLRPNDVYTPFLWSGGNLARWVSACVLCYIFYDLFTRSSEALRSFEGGNSILAVLVLLAVLILLGLLVFRICACVLVQKIELSKQTAHLESPPVVYGSNRTIPIQGMQMGAVWENSQTGKIFL